MAFEFELPDVGEGVAEGELLEWHVAVGDHVEEDEVLAEVETDKAVVDLPSPVAGTVRELRAEEGDVVPVGDVVVTIDVDGEVPDEVDADGAVDTDDSTDETEDKSDGTEAAGGGGRVFAPPNVRRLAREMDVDITTVSGSGPGGRVTEADVRGAAGKGGSDDEAVASAITGVDDGDSGDDSGPKSAVSKASSGTKSAVSKAKSATKSAVSKADSSHEGTGSADRERTLAAPSTRRLADEEGVDIDDVPTEKTRDGEAYVEAEDVRAYAEAQQAEKSESEAGSETAAAGTEGTAASDAVSTDGEVTREPYRGIRRTIGQQMEQSVYTAPHVSHHDTAVVDDLVATRADLKPRAEERGVLLTYLPFVMKAVVAGLKEFPVLNTTLDEESEKILYKHFYNIGVAVATDAGLMVPVVENVDEKGILQLASETAELTERARERNLTREEMQGGTFSITNFGAIGGEYATPIINYPETAILGLGSIEQRPVVRDGEVVAAHTLPLSLSIDHRVIDGAEAARFVNTVIEYLENPQLLLLE
jgi:pyruvate dehydrogenase E2 component (dihydrolipoamide acetyltransferase)